MIYLLIILVAVKYRDVLTDMVYTQDELDDEVDEILKPGAGIEYQESSKRDHLRVVK